jgi:hypothetical protein
MSGVSTEMVRSNLRSIDHCIIINDTAVCLHLIVTVPTKNISGEARTPPKAHACKVSPSTSNAPGAAAKTGSDTMCIKHVLMGSNTFDRQQQQPTQTDTDSWP